jgi:hypothetical protein
MYKCKRLEKRLNEIGLGTMNNGAWIQIRGALKVKGIRKTKNEIYNKILSDVKNKQLVDEHCFKIFIEVGSPFSEDENVPLFEGCSIVSDRDKYYPELEDVVRRVKFNIIGILNENKLFDGVDYKLPENYKDTIIP